MLRVELEKSFITSGPGFSLGHGAILLLKMNHDFYCSLLLNHYESYLLYSFFICQ